MKDQGTSIRETSFTDAVAVDAWDAWFRWRENGALRDLTIDVTWDRVTAALTSVESPASAANWKQRFFDAFRELRLLPDERILATAGTGAHSWGYDRPVAVLNVASFVRAPTRSNAVFDQAAFEDIAILAVRALDNATLMIGNGTRINAGFRIGVVGFADALELLGLEYDSENGRSQAEVVARALAHGCLRGSLELARERGVTAARTDVWRESMQSRGFSSTVVDEAARIGIRHGQLTAITSQQKLALFSNNVADALDPMTAGHRKRVAMNRNTKRQLGEAGSCPAGSSVSPSAQRELRASIQRWVDEPIDYPLQVDAAPNAH